MAYSQIGRRRKGFPFKRLLLIIIVAVLVVGYVYYWYTANIPVTNDSSEKTFVVNEGSGSTDISHQLKDEGFIRSPLAFQFYTWSRGISSKLQIGEYDLPQNLTLKEIAEILHKGIQSDFEEVTITLIEGWNNNEYAAYLEEKGIMTQEEFFAVVQKKADWWDDYDFLKSRPKSTDLEGYLFPDTYRLFVTATPEDVIKKMLDNFDEKLTAEMRQEIKSQGKTIHEILTLAAIIEKEVIDDIDRRKVADIFYKRLEEGIALQADSTVNYITNKGTARSSFDDIAIDNPYNTYKYRGLPPGPISNPAITAIEAAIRPDPNPYFYFLTTPEGEVKYAKTFDEHKANRVFLD